MTEAVEVADGQPGGRCRADGLLDPYTQLAGGLDVVRQDEEILGEEIILGLEQPVDPLDDDPRLAGARARDDDHWPIGVLDDRPLRIGQRKFMALWGSRWRYGDVRSPSVVS